MSTTINSRIKQKRDTTSNWNNAIGFIPLKGEIIIYTDYETKTEEIDGVSTTVNIPGLKIGDGSAYVQDLPFVGEESRRRILEHIENQSIHITESERQFWNDKLNVNDISEVVNNTLVFNRD